MYFGVVGFDLVLDTTVSRELSLLESCREFIERKAKYDGGDKSALPMLSGICPGEWNECWTLLCIHWGWEAVRWMPWYSKYYNTVKVETTIANNSISVVYFV